MDLKIHFANESGYNVFHILCEALFYMKYGNLESYHQDRTEGIMLAIRYLQKLLQQWKIKIRIFSVYFDKRNKTDFAKHFTQPSEINLFLEAATLEWNNLKERRKIKEKENQLWWIYFPYEKPEQDPDSEEFWFYYYDGISVSHPDDSFWDEPKNSEDNDMEAK